MRRAPGGGATGADKDDIFGTPESSTEFFKKCKFCRKSLERGATGPGWTRQFLSEASRSGFEDGGRIHFQVSLVINLYRRLSPISHKLYKPRG